MIIYYNGNKFNQASKELNLFVTYKKADYKDVKLYTKKITIKTLEAKVKKIPASKAAANLSIYKQLSALDPKNKLYKEKIVIYTEKAEQQRRRAEREKKARLKREAEARKARERRVARFGNPPENSAWDGSVRCVKDYLKQIARDPDSLKFEKWGTVTYNDDAGWLVWCQYRGKNAFGGYIRNVNWFVIRHNRVIEMKEFSAYR